MDNTVSRECQKASLVSPQVRRIGVNTQTGGGELKKWYYAPSNRPFVIKVTSLAWLIRRDDAIVVVETKPDGSNAHAPTARVVTRSS